MNAADPISLCGKGLKFIDLTLPGRFNTTHMVFHGEKIVVISKNNGKELIFNISEKNKNIADYLEFINILVSRKFNPLKKIKTEIINNKPAIKSLFKSELINFGFYVEYKSLIFEKKY